MGILSWKEKLNRSGLVFWWDEGSGIQNLVLLFCNFRLYIHNGLNGRRKLLHFEPDLFQSERSRVQMTSRCDAPTRTRIRMTSIVASGSKVGPHYISSFLSDSSMVHIYGVHLLERPLMDFGPLLISNIVHSCNGSSNEGQAQTTIIWYDVSGQYRYFQCQLQHCYSTDYSNNALRWWKIGKLDSM